MQNFGKSAINEGRWADSYKKNQKKTKKQKQQQTREGGGWGVGVRGISFGFVDLEGIKRDRH